MSRALQISLMILTASLCGFCILQWQRESRATARQRSLFLELAAAQEASQSQTAKLALWEQEISRLTTALADQAASRTALSGMQAKLDELTRQLEAKTTALTEFSSVSETVRLQLAKALDERDALAARLNARTREFNALADKFRKTQ